MSEEYVPPQYEQNAKDFARSIRPDVFGFLQEHFYELGGITITLNVIDQRDLAIFGGELTASLATFAEGLVETPEEIAELSDIKGEALVQSEGAEAKPSEGTIVILRFAAITITDEQIKLINQAGETFSKLAAENDKKPSVLGEAYTEAFGNRYISFRVLFENK